MKLNVIQTIPNYTESTVRRQNVDGE